MYFRYRASACYLISMLHVVLGHAVTRINGVKGVTHLHLHLMLWHNLMMSSDTVDCYLHKLYRS